MEDEMNDAIESELGYGDSKAGWIREACRQRLQREGVELPDDAETDGGQTVLAD
jgi:hypothetical protein